MKKMANIDFKKIDKKLIIVIVIVVIALISGYTYKQSTTHGLSSKQETTTSTDDCNKNVAQADQDISSCMYVGCNDFF